MDTSYHVQGRNVKPAGRIHWSAIVFLVGFTILLIGVVYFALIPGMEAAARSNLEALELTDRARAVRSDAARFLRRADEASYDLVLCDPPYRLADRLAADLDPLIRGVLAESGRAMIESSPDNPLQVDLPLLTERTYGETHVRVYGADR